MINDVVSISYIRIAIFVLALIFLCLFLFIMNRTRLGLEVRAVTQNPRMAASMGINPDRINMLTFGLGSGIAGVAGVAIGLYAKVTSEMGTDYIVQSFMTVVVGGVGNVWGTLAGASMIGFVQKGIEWLNPSNTLGRTNLHDPLHHPVHSIPPKGHRRPQGPRGRGLSHERTISSIAQKPVSCLAGSCLVDCSQSVHNGRDDAVRRPRPGVISTVFVKTLGKTLCLCLVAIAMDVVWGYCGIFRLATSRSFGIGGYAIGMWLMYARTELIVVESLAANLSRHAARNIRRDRQANLRRCRRSEFPMIWAFAHSCHYNFWRSSWCPASWLWSLAGSPFAAASLAFTCRS